MILGGHESADFQRSQRAPFRMPDGPGPVSVESSQRASFAMYVLGLLSELQRKSIDSISTLFVTEYDEADSVHQRLLHFWGAAPWPDDVRRTAVRFALADLARRSHSIGVQRRYCAALGTVAHCQVIASLTTAQKRAHLPIDAQPYCRWSPKSDQI